MRIVNCLAIVAAISGGAAAAFGQSSPNGTIANVSALVRIPAGQGALSPALGFTVRSSSPLLLRGVGPALARYGMSGTAVAPYLDFFTPAGPVNFGARVAIAWDWNAAAAAVGAFPLPSPGGTPVNGQIPEDSSDVESFQAGAYTTRAVDNSRQGGLALIELYTGGVLIPLGNQGPVSLAPQVATPSGFISNFSLFFGGPQATASQVLGFSVSAPTTVLIRAVGPSLAAFGIFNGARNPTFQLWSGSAPYGFGTLAFPASFWPYIDRSVGAFPLSQDTADVSAIAFLQAGSYTLTANDTSGAAGMILLEVYANPDLSQVSK